MILYVCRKLVKMTALGSITAYLLNVDGCHELDENGAAKVQPIHKLTVFQ